ncbi:mediator of RNA polymerase II transcription subunit 22-like [Mya arenaria]|nr:mediator of RNA polymerase II transcription subunit 22-like [Mya arenaria]XP_052787894.1 mediator of RNA polymerase II transcription subunit 22-like [Mya arenaria]
MSQAPSSQRTIPQSKEALLKSYTIRLRADIKSMLDSFTEIIRLARVEEDSQVSRITQAEQDQYEMQVRASNIVRAGESLMKLVSDLKIYLILNDFPSVNESISNNTQMYKTLQNENDAKLLTVRDDLATDLYELEDEYYSSMYK